MKTDTIYLCRKIKNNWENYNQKIQNYKAKFY